MSFAHSLLKSPLWQAADLGKPVPPEAGEHAVSVCLPTWADVLGYEEGQESVLHALEAGYPRFRLPESVCELGRQAFPQARLALPFPAAAAKRVELQLKAERIPHQTLTQAHSSNQDPYPVTIVAIENEAGERVLRKLWRYYGEGISSRQAVSLLGNTLADSSKVEAQALSGLQKLLAKSYRIPPSHLLLFPTGMAANAAVLRALVQLRGALPSYQFGFPYVDCLRLQGEFSGVHFAAAETFANTLDWLDQGAQLQGRDCLALFCEAITNPQIQVLKLPELYRACQQAALPLIVDDSVPSAGLLQSLPHADVLTSSLTKWVSGHADVMGGLVALNPESPWTSQLLPLLSQAATEIALAQEDALVLLGHAQGFPQRVQQAAHNALQVGNWLEAQAPVRQLWWSHSQENLSAWQQLALSPELATQAAAPLLSFQLENEEKAAAFYDALAISKGPSFGTQWSFVCPYTLLAHYDELDWCSQQGVPRDLIRLSIGLEEPEELISRLEQALFG